jgi:hypothetical protein
MLDVFWLKKAWFQPLAIIRAARLRWFDLSHAWQWLHGPESMATASLTRGGTVPPQFLGSYREKFEGRERGRKAKRLSKTKSGAPVARRT